MDTANIEFVNLNKNFKVDIEVPLNISANDLIMSLNEVYNLDISKENIFSCYLISENPIAFLRGKKTLEEFGIRNGTIILYKRD